MSDFFSVECALDDTGDLSVERCCASMVLVGGGSSGPSRHDQPGVGVRASRKPAWQAIHCPAIRDLCKHPGSAHALRDAAVLSVTDNAYFVKPALIGRPSALYTSSQLWHVFCGLFCDHRGLHCGRSRAGNQVSQFWSDHHHQWSQMGATFRIECIQ